MPWFFTLGNANIFGETLVTQEGSRAEIGGNSAAAGGLERRIYITQNPMMIVDSSEGSAWSSDEDIEHQQRNMTSTMGRRFLSRSRRLLPIFAWRQGLRSQWAKSP